MNLRTGSRLFVPRGKGRSADYQAFLAEARSAYRGWHVALLLDEDPSHTAKASLQAAEGLTLLWLPKRSPKLNPMEPLWGQAKDAISASKQYATIDEQVDRFLRHRARAVEPGGAAYVGCPLQEVLAQTGVVTFILRDCLVLGGG